MKKLSMFLLITGIAIFAFASGVNAATTTGAIAVRAVIAAGTPDMGFEIHKMNDGNADHDPWTNYSLVSNLTFDAWNIVQKTGKAAQWASATQNTIIVYASGMGDDYQIFADGTGSLTGPGGTLAAGTLACTPIYSATDLWWVDVDGDGVKDPGETYAQGAMPGTLGSTGAILGVTGKSIYSSESPVGSARILQILFMFPSYNNDGTDPYSGYAPIPATIAAGTYQGASVTVRIAAK
ncbi:MAG: hypothetical protein A2166_01960 [Omnitrophica WOR_2 bacterium RBG_13_41_10]|nr:MAG: hypothetical protein A2166_01960 [Omnitrophica WOR_2 bacterium RBG_13_41_10]